MCNYEGRSFDLEEPTKEEEEDQLFSFSSVVQDQKTNDNDNSQISPLDALTALFLCCDNFLRQIFIEKLSLCQLAIPLLIPVTDVRDKEWELIVWGMSTITKKWKTSSGLSCEKSMVEEDLPILSALRLGRPNISKSKIVNCVINEQKHDIFFNSGCKGGNLKRKLTNGLLEMTWYLPTQKHTFSDALTFINLRGNASKLKDQTQFLSAISVVTVVFVSFADADFNQDDVSLLESLYKQKGDVIFILDGSPGPKLQEVFVKMEGKKDKAKKQIQFSMSSNKNELKISTEIWKLLESKFQEGKRRNANNKRIQTCIEKAQEMNFHVDELVQDCSKMKSSADALLSRINNVESGKQKELPVQMVTKRLGEKKKEKYRLLKKGNMQIENYVDRLQQEILDLRHTQLRKHRDGHYTYDLFRGSFSNTLINRKYYFGFVKIMTDRYSIEKLQPIRTEYIEKWNALCNLRKNKPGTSKASLTSRQTELDELEEKLSRESLGLEHFNREIVQIYEMSSALKLSTGEFNNSHLPEVAAEMLLHGYPIELMDGDAVYVPLTWIKAVFNSLKCQIGNKKMFVLSVLGIQSSGKSTMLNAMFGLQFAVSAGRCTKGIFAQLVSLDTELQKETNCDLILVVDTEGLRSPEFDSDQQNNSHDNELATLVIGLGDLTIINIMGENPTDMQDTLQIAVHAFMKMENVNINPSCLFVHQNITDVTADDKTTTQKRSMLEKLDKMTTIAAKAEHCSDRYESFSDVIHFQENEHIMYISTLWQGEPPMAPPNPGYSQGILKVKKQVLELMKKSKPNHIDEFTILLTDLWNAIICENFVFSFKNSLEIQAFIALNVEFVKHARTFRICTLEHSDGIQTECKKLTAEKMKEDGKNIIDTYLKKLEADIDFFQTSMATYFQEEIKACQWKGKIEIQLQDLCRESERELNEVFKSTQKRIIGRADIDANIKKQEQVIYQKAKELADKHRNEHLSDEDLEQEFATHWNTWVSVIPSSDDYVNIKESFQEITGEYFLENDAKEVAKVLKNTFSDTNVQETDLLLGQSESDFIRRAVEFLGNITGGSVSKKAYVNQANYFKQRIIENLTREIAIHAQEGKQYTKQFGHKLLSSLSCELKMIKLGEKVSISQQGQIRLAVCIYKVELIPRLERIQEQYKRENEPRLYMESKRKDLWQMFKEECKDLHIIVKVALTISRELKSAIETSLPKKCELGIIDYLRHCSGKGFSSKMSLHAWMLIEIAEKGNFQSFVPYLSNPIQCIRTFTSEKIERMCLHNNETGTSVLQKIHSDKVHETVSGLKQAIFTLKSECAMTMKPWWSTLLERINKGLCVKPNIRFFEEERDLDLKELCDELLTELEKTEEAIVKEYDSSIFNEINTTCCDLFTADLLACQEVCPFCFALCELNGIHDHHRTDCHRPKGVAGYRWEESKKLNSDICTTAVLSDYRFRNKHTNKEWINYRNYRTVNERYASWKIEPLPGESEMFWKWFMAKYNTQLANYYDCKLADIPDGWKDITMKEATEDMKKVYDI
ncbi:interferon-induced very large GTPase 1-like [Antedon mediterranea]|uniref:interferon-induced very large GTPase 1-like n=1 Tax=Antedon mediterranea TaxID=105859 RepID=UPI003AF434B6